MFALLLILAHRPRQEIGPTGDVHASFSDMDVAERIEHVGLLAPLPAQWNYRFNRNYGGSLFSFTQYSLSLSFDYRQL